jgi:hypothetical protein
MILLNVFRADKTNAGDWWCPPIRYFQFKRAKAVDILNFKMLPNEEYLLVLGGGGLGRPFFQNAIQSIARPDRKYKLITWGTGSDVLEDRTGTVRRPGSLVGNYFQDFDLNGLRIFDPQALHVWVPCASCMWRGFDELRKSPPRERLGFYEHKRVPLPIGDKKLYPILSNDGDSIQEKASFIARFEIIVTNSYHGVYWGTLLNRKVICVPFKSGLFSFKHSPKFATEYLGNIYYERVPNYPDALEECRNANITYYKNLKQTFDV